MDKRQSVRNLFPDTLRQSFEQAVSRYDTLSEIRIRCDRPVLIRRRQQEFFLYRDGSEGSRAKEALILDDKRLEALFQHICRYSPYAYQDEVRQGFLTVSGGHRIGVAGQAVCSMECVQGLRNIRFLNIRIAHEIKGAADECIPYVYHPETGQIQNTLIIAEPGCGKTTLLRDLVRQISNGTAYGRGRTVGVVDERSELAGCFLGVPQNDLGIRTDVLDACPKSAGMLMLLRSMSPEVIAVDEIATDEDVKSLLYLLHCGVRVFVTVHGSGLDEVKKKPFLAPLLRHDYFDTYLVIQKHSVKKLA